MTRFKISRRKITHAGAMPGSITSMSSETGYIPSVSKRHPNVEIKPTVDRIIPNYLANALDNPLVAYLLDVLGM
jgi:hypothetical protein